jgi:hypothetical protein
VSEHPPITHPLHVPPLHAGGVRLAVVIPARDEADRIASTIEAVRSIPSVDAVVVVDDGSTDATAGRARKAGAQVVSHRSNRGKAAALHTGVRALDRSGVDEHLLVFLDADLGESARHADQLVEPVASGRAACAIAVLPQTAGAGGHGFVVRLARDGIRQATGRQMQAPLSGQRCLTRSAFAAAEPLAPGWGVEVGMTIDVLRAGMSVEEVPVPFQHRVTGRDFAGQLHRARQWRDVARALAARQVRPSRDAVPLPDQLGKVTATLDQAGAVAGSVAGRVGPAADAAREQAGRLLGKARKRLPRRGRGPTR